MDAVGKEAGGGEDEAGGGGGGGDFWYSNLRLEALDSSFVT